MIMYEPQRRPNETGEMSPYPFAANHSGRGRIDWPRAKARAGAVPVPLLWVRTSALETFNALLGNARAEKVRYVYSSLGTLTERGKLGVPSEFSAWP